MPSLFSKIVNGEIPSHKIAEDDNFFAFLDVFPLVPGHVLVVPKKETDYIFDIGDAELAQMMVFAKQVAVVLKKAMPCKRIGVAVIGLEVPHAHVHLIPLNSMADFSFKEPMEIPAEEMRELAANIAALV